MRIYPGAGGRAQPSYVAHSAITAEPQVGVGRWDSDGAPDTPVPHGTTRLRVYFGNGPGGLTGPRPLGLDARAYDWVLGVGDMRLAATQTCSPAREATGDLYLLRGDRDAGSGAPASSATGMDALRPGRLTGQPRGKRAVARSAAYVASSRPGSAWATRTIEPPGRAAR